MNPLLTALLVLFAVAVVVTIVAVAQARDGHEDETGFHAGARSPRRRATRRVRRHRLPVAA